MTTEDYYKSKNTVKTYFPNGIVYCSSVYEKNQLLKSSKFHTNGKLAQRIKYEDGKISVKEIYNRNGEISETYSYEYNTNGFVTKITQEKINTLYTVIFDREEITNRIILIYVKQNTIIVRRIEFEYFAKAIQCKDSDDYKSLAYTLISPPRADESWLNINPANSLVMRKLKTALELSA